VRAPAAARLSNRLATTESEAGQRDEGEIAERKTPRNHAVTADQIEHQPGHNPTRVAHIEWKPIVAPRCLNRPLRLDLTVSF
jgi:hypothetical protein